MKSIEPFLVFGEHIFQTALFATSGSTQGGIIAYFLALAPPGSARSSSLDRFVTRAVNLGNTFLVVVLFSGSSVDLLNSLL